MLVGARPMRKRGAGREKSIECVIADATNTYSVLADLVGQGPSATPTWEIGGAAGGWGMKRGVAPDLARAMPAEFRPHLRIPALRPDDTPRSID